MSDETRLSKHPHAPERCPVCEWTNINLMNYGDADRSAWMCHGCAARTIAEVRHWRGLLSTERVEALRWLRATLGAMRFDPHPPEVGFVAANALDALLAAAQEVGRG